jgi:3-hydroxyisobutyrate dehydrogenase
VPTSPANRDYQPGFATALMLKDLKLAQAASQAAGASTPMGGLAAQLYSLHAGNGQGGTDFSSIIKLLRGIDAGTAR